jgi:hypothetical protein
VPFGAHAYRGSADHSEERRTLKTPSSAHVARRLASFAILTNILAPLALLLSRARIFNLTYDPCHLSSQLSVISFEIGDNLLHFIGLHSNNCAYLASAAGLRPRFCGARSARCLSDIATIVIDTRGGSVSTIDALGYSNFSQQYYYHHSFALFPAGHSFLLGT